MKIGYESLTVWQQSIELSLLIYKLTKSFPADERYGLTSQMRRCSISIPSNIAEGKGRLSDVELRRFCLISNGSAMELKTQLHMAKKLELAPLEVFREIDIKMDYVLRLLNSFIVSLSKANS